jgi:hypothetical protein
MSRDEIVPTYRTTMPPGSLKGLVLEVDDVDQVAQDLMSRSIPVEGGVEEAPWGRFVQIDDSEGNGLVLQQSAGR